MIMQRSESCDPSSHGLLKRTPGYEVEQRERIKRQAIGHRRLQRRKIAS